MDATKLAEAGWGVIFASDDAQTDAIKDALAPLLKLRREQASQQNERFYREFVGDDGYLPDEKKTDWLARHEADVTGPADPNQAPYYLLIVGDPQRIPYRFQYQLDVQYAVGRLHFETLDEYAQYAQSVVAAETGKVSLSRQAAFFGVRNPDDRATNLSAPELVAPLAESLKSRKPWNVQTYLESEATKARLATLLGGEQTPALLFTASHGMGFPNGHAKQLSQQGALLCQDWPGPLQHRGAIPQDFYFAADDVSDDARLLGLMAFHFACYGAGTPSLDDFAHLSARESKPIAPHAFLARLPQRLLGHPKGGALAVVGHVERAWGYSFMWERAKRQLVTFEDAMKQIMAGLPIGAALESFNSRYAELSSELTSELDLIKKMRTPDEAKLTGLWTANNDARAYIIIGDPAARLPLGEGTTQRPTMESITITPVRNTGDANVVASGAATIAMDAPPASVDVTMVQQLHARMTAMLGQFAEKVDAALKAATDDAQAVEVATYTSEALSSAEPFAGAAQLRALTRIQPNGNIQTVMPKDGTIDDALWQKHLTLVERAQAQRVERLKALADALARVAAALRE